MAARRPVAGVRPAAAFPEDEGEAEAEEGPLAEAKPVWRPVLVPDEVVFVGVAFAVTFEEDAGNLMVC